ncbi:unnamed protein product [Durusdinium trenchii]|uniref:VWFA domain-containing protein n=1 Tax=Durusdinium trenchii TaxID=1381693 RepID=A0ABP0PID4_9DINO
MSGLDSSASACQTQLLDILDCGERRQYDLMMALTKGGHGCRELFQAVWQLRDRIDQIFDLAGLSQGAGSNLKYDSRCIKSELDCLQQVIADFKKLEQRLCSFCDPAHREAAFKAIQAASNQILSSDILGEIGGVWEEHQKFQEKQKDLETKRGEETAELKLKEAQVDFLSRKLSAAKDNTAWIKEMLKQKQEEHEDLKSRKENSAKDFIFRCHGAKEEAKRKKQELADKMEEDQKTSRAPLDDCEEKIRNLQKDMLNLDRININHIIIALDNSGSMAGQRWKSACKAVEAFQNACVSRGSIDKVSIIPFNSDAKCLVRAAPVANKMADKLRREGCGGGTCFVSAWDQIAECIESEPKFAAIFVVFLTDGFSQDIPEATVKAEALFEAAGRQGRQMSAFFVHINEPGFEPWPVEHVETTLQPLVKAANGGRVQVDYLDQHISLLQVVQSQDLVPAFERLTSLVNLEKCILEARMAMLRDMQKEYTTKCSEHYQQLKQHYEQEVKMLSDVASKVEKSGKHDKNYLCGLYQSLESTVQKEITQLQTSLNKAEDSEDALRKKFVECESKYNSCLQYFEKSQQDYETKSAELQKQCQTHLAQLERIHEKQKKLVDRFGSSNTHVLQLQLESLQKMKEQWDDSGEDQIEQPLPRVDRDALKMILQQRDLQYDGVPQMDMERLLEHEAKLQCDDDDGEVSKIIQTFRATGISAEQICEAVDAEGEKLKEAKEELVGLLQERAFEEQGCQSEGVEKQLKGKKKELQGKKEELAKKEQEMRESKRKKKQARSNVSTSASEEEDGWELIDNLENEVQALKEEKQSLEGELKELESDLKTLKKDQQGICKDLKPCCRVLDFVVDACRTAFFELIAEKEKFALKAIFESFQNTVSGPMKVFAKMTDQAREVFEHDVSVPLSSSRVVCDMGRTTLAVEDAE